MIEQLEPAARSHRSLAFIGDHVRCRLASRVGDFRLVFRDDGLVLRGRTRNYYAKQLVLHEVMKITDLPIHANEIEVY